MLQHCCDPNNSHATRAPAGAADVPQNTRAATSESLATPSASVQRFRVCARLRGFLCPLSLQDLPAPVIHDEASGDGKVVPKKSRIFGVLPARLGADDHAPPSPPRTRQRW